MPLLITLLVAKPSGVIAANITNMSTIDCLRNAVLSNRLPNAKAAGIWCMAIPKTN